MLYVDEAHSIGVRGQQGLGCAEQYNVIQEIDFLVGTLGKALAAVGGYIICHPIIKDYLINKMRPLILVLLNLRLLWLGQILFSKVLNAQSQREHLKILANIFNKQWCKRGM